MSPEMRRVYESGPWTLATVEFTDQVGGHKPHRGLSFELRLPNGLPLVSGETVAITATIPPGALTRCLENAYLLPALLAFISDVASNCEEPELRAGAIQLNHLLRERLKLPVDQLSGEWVK